MGTDDLKLTLMGLLEIWQAAAGEFGRAYPKMKVQFDYLDHERGTGLTH